jgi:DNA-binding MarR family transcriptional regulator
MTSLHYLLMRSHSLLNRRILEEAAELGLSPGQPKVLEYLRLHGTQNQRSIADYCRIEPATVGSILTRMEEAGLVERRQKPGDRRALYVSLTAAGESAAEAVAQLFDRADRQAASLLTQAETEHLTALLEKVCAALPEEVIQG